MCPWVSTVWWTLPCVGNASCFGYSFEKRVKNRFFPLPRPLLSKPQSMWGISDTIQGKPVSPHTSHLSEGASEWMKLKHRQKPEVSIYSSEGTQPGSRHCQRPSLWVVNESSSWIWVQYIPSQSHTSPYLLLLFHRVIILSKPKLPVRMGVSKEIPSPWGREAEANHFLQSTCPGTLEVNRANQREPFKHAACWDPVHFLFSISIVLTTLSHHPFATETKSSHSVVK